MKYDEVTFVSGGIECHAWHFTGEGDALATDAGRPVVVMAHGLAGTKDSGLQPFAEALAGAGLDVFAFDYRGFGAQRRVAAADGLDGRPARGLPRRDGGRRPAARCRPAAGSCSGASRSPAATCSPPRRDRDDVAAVVALTPLVDGMAAGRHALAHTQALGDAPLHGRWASAAGSARR